MIPQKVIFNSGSTILDSTSQSLQKFGNQIGSELFFTNPRTGKSFQNIERIPNGLKFYSTTLASSYNNIDRRRAHNNQCPLQMYIDEDVNTMHEDERDQPYCSCDPENHLHVFRLPFIYFLIDGNDKQGRHREIIEILRTIQKNKIYTHSTNKNKNKMNLADKLIKLSRQEFEKEETLRLVSKE